MSEPFDPARLGIALDEAEANGLHPEFTALLKAMVGKAGLLDRLVRRIEGDLRYDIDHGEFQRSRNAALLAFVAEHRGETPEATLARLSPPHPEPPAFPLGRGYFTEAEGEQIRNLGLPRIDPRARPREETATPRGIMPAHALFPAQQLDQPAIDIQHLVDRLVADDLRRLEAFVREHVALPGTHELVHYRQGLGGETVHVLMPLGERPPGADYPTLEQAVARYPHLRSRP